MTNVERPVFVREPFNITPEQLIEANQTPLAKNRLAEYKSARDSNGLTLLVVCSDARSGPSWISRNDVRADRSIAAGIDPSTKGDSIRDPHVKQIIIATHFDMSASLEAGYFKGCGGLAAYNVFSGVHEHEDHANPVAPYIRGRIRTDNPMVKAFHQKDEIMNQFKEDGDFKPIMIAPIAHDTGLLMPVWYVYQEEDTGEFVTRGTLQSHQLQQQERVRPDGITTLDPVRLPDNFRAILDSNRDFVADQTQLLEHQKVQDPGVVFATTKSTPLRVRFGNKFEEPNRVFVVGVAFEKRDGDEVIADPETPLAQISYPIQNNLQALQEGDSFYSTRTIVFEAGKLNEARFLALRFAEQPWAQEWIVSRNGKIILAETKSGKTTRAEYLPI